MDPSSRETPGISLPASGQDAANDGGASASASGPPVADDGDKVEKEWVDKTKRIIAETRHDPHKQSERLTAMKADYMKRRYNKIIKVEE